MTDTLQANPEPVMPDAPLVSPVVQDILCASYADELATGKTEFADGTDPEWKAACESAVKRWVDLRSAGKQTHFDLVLAQAFTCAVADDMESLYRRVIFLAQYALDWAEHLADRGHRPSDEVMLEDPDEVYEDDE